MTTSLLHQGATETDAAKVERLLLHIHRINHRMVVDPKACRRCAALYRGLPDEPEGWRQVDA